MCVCVCVCVCVCAQVDGSTRGTFDGMHELGVIDKQLRVHTRFSPVSKPQTVNAKPKTVNAANPPPNLKP
jgi:hypothetical protein